MLCYVMVTLNTSFSLWLQVFFYSIRVQVEQHPVTGRWSQSLHSFPNLFVIAPNCPQGTTKNWCYNHSTSPVRSRYFTTFPFFLSLISASSGRCSRPFLLIPRQDLVYTLDNTTLLYIRSLLQKIFN